MVDKTSGIEASLPIVSEEEVPAMRDAVRHLRVISLPGGVTECFSIISVIEISLFIETDFVLFIRRFEVDVSSADNDAVSGKSDDAFDIEALLLVGRPKDHDVSPIGLPEKEGKLIDDDVFIVFQGARHGIALDLERRNKKCPDPRDDGDDNDDVEEDIEEVEPKAGALFLEEHRRIVSGEGHAV